MKRLVLSASVLALLSGIALAAPAEAATYKRHTARVMHSERIAIARSKHHLKVVVRQARRNGHVSLWERARIRMAASRLHRTVKHAHRN